MTVEIEIPGGNATFRTAAELTNRQVKELRRVARKVGVVGQRLRSLGLDDVRADDEDETDDKATEERNSKALSILSNLTDDEDDMLDLFQRECVVLRLVDWTLDRPIPATAADVDDLPRNLYTVLTTEAAKLDLNESFDKDEGLLDPTVHIGDLESSEPPSQEASS